MRECELEKSEAIKNINYRRLEIIHTMQKADEPYLGFRLLFIDILQKSENVHTIKKVRPENTFP